MSRRGRLSLFLAVGVGLVALAGSSFQRTNTDQAVVAALGAEAKSAPPRENLFSHQTREFRIDLPEGFAKVDEVDMVYDGYVMDAGKPKLDGSKWPVYSARFVLGAPSVLGTSAGETVPTVVVTQIHGNAHTPAELATIKGSHRGGKASQVRGREAVIVGESGWIGIQWRENAALAYSVTGRNVPESLIATVADSLGTQP